MALRTCSTIADWYHTTAAPGRPDLLQLSQINLIHELFWTTPGKSKNLLMFNGPILRGLGLGIHSRKKQGKTGAVASGGLRTVEVKSPERSRMSKSEEGGLRILPRDVRPHKIRILNSIYPEFW